MSTGLIEATFIPENNVDIAQMTFVIDKNRDQKVLSYVYTSSNINESLYDALYRGHEEALNLSINALKNLFKKFDFLQLNYQLETKQITNEEFNEEIENNEAKYFIEQHKFEPTVEQLQMVSNIIKMVGKDKELTVDDIEDLFDLDIIKYINSVDNAKKI